MFLPFLVFQTTAPFKIPKTQASCNLMALASQQGIVDSPNSSKMSTDAREICHHHWSPYPSARHSASESSKTTFGRYKGPVLYLRLFFSNTLADILVDAFMHPLGEILCLCVCMGFLMG